MKMIFSNMEVSSQALSHFNQQMRICTFSLYRKLEIFNQFNTRERWRQNVTLDINIFVMIYLRPLKPFKSVSWFWWHKKHQQSGTIMQIDARQTKHHVPWFDLCHQLWYSSITAWWIWDFLGYIRCSNSVCDSTWPFISKNWLRIIKQADCGTTRGSKQNQRRQPL